MRKKIIVILLCVSLISIIALSFVACNNQEDDNDGYVGTWIGYLEGDKTIQMYATVKELFKPKEGAPFSLVFISVLNPDISWATAKGRIIEGEQEITFYASTYPLYDTYSMSDISDNTFTLFNSEKTLHFKRADLSEEKWRDRAFKKTGDYTYEPYYYEE